MCSSLVVAGGVKAVGVVVHRHMVSKISYRMLVEEGKERMVLQWSYRAASTFICIPDSSSIG